MSIAALAFWQVNDVPFQNLTREEAVQFLLGLPPGEEMELVTQRKQDSECAWMWVCLCFAGGGPGCVAWW